MSKWIEIKKVSEFDKIKSLYWDDAFVREIYMLSPSYVDFDGGLIEDHSLNILILIFFADGTKDNIGIEFFLKEVENFNLSLYGCFLDEEPDLVSLSSFKTVFELKLADSLMKVNGLKYRFIDESYLGNRIEYGKKDFYYDKKFFPNENSREFDDIRELSLYDKVNTLEDIEKGFLKVQSEVGKLKQRVINLVKLLSSMNIPIDKIIETTKLSKKEIEEIIGQV